jgi:hypothetical protein
MQAKSLIQAKYLGFTFLFLSLPVFFIHHIWSFSAFENALFQGR